MKKRFKGKRKRSSPVLPSDPHDRVVVRMPCYEPAGQFVDLTENDILQHVLVTGSSGGGKTSCLFGILADLIAYRSDDEAHRPGLVIMDNQADSTIHKIRHLAAKAGREQDVLHLSPDEGWYCPVGVLNDWAEIDRATERLISASRFMDEKGDNRYWAEVTKNLATMCLVVMLVTSGQVRFTDLLHFASDWLVGGADTSPTVKRRLDVFRTVAEQAMPTLTPAIAIKIRFAISTLHNWQNMDYRSKAILRSCMSTVLRPFLSVFGLRYWDHRRGPRIDPAQALHGKIVVISIPAGVEPELATVLGRLAKMDFYAAAQRRNYKPGDRLVAMVQDEFPYSVTVGSSRWSDVTNLATLRARGAFLLCASQGIANLLLAIGSGNGNAGTAILLNFSNIIFFRSQEPAIDLWAARLFGLKVTQAARPKEPPHAGNRSSLAVEDSPSTTPQDLLELACPLGRLSRLHVHQAFICLANGWRTQEPVWLAPNYIEVDVPNPTPASSDEDMKIITEIRNQIPPLEGIGDVSL